MNPYHIILGIIFVSITGTLLHFAYHWSGNNFIAGLLSPVNESVWEHLKLLFYPMLFWGLFEIGSVSDSCRASAYSAGILIGTLLIPTIYYTYTAILGKNYLLLDILLFFLSVITAFLSYYYFAVHCTLNQYKQPLSFAVFLLLIFFLIFTYYPPPFSIFRTP